MTASPNSGSATDHHRIAPTDLNYAVSNGWVSARQVRLGITQRTHWAAVWHVYRLGQPRDGIART